MNNETINFSFVVHKGYLETQSILLVCSILNIYGKDANIFAGVPEHLGGIESGVSSELKEILSELGVIFFPVQNPIGEDYPIGNKLGCFANVNYGVKIFLDTDTILLKRLDLTCLPSSCVALKPADRKTYKWSDDDWKYAYKKYSGVDHVNMELYSTCFHELMHPYYNAGVIIIRGCNDFKEDWCTISQSVDNDSQLMNKRPWLDQLSLPLVLRKNNFKVINLCESFNFPAHLKPVKDFAPFIVHYHWPNILSRDCMLLQYVRKLTKSYPILTSIFQKSTEDWQELNALVGNQSFHSNGAEINLDFYECNNILLTGIPRSGTSYLCSLLSKYNDSFVLNEPKEIFKPLNRQPIPYGINGFYMETRKNIRLNKPVENKHQDGKLISDTIHEDQRSLYSKPDILENYHLFTKNTLGYMFALERLNQVMPSAVKIAVFRNPVDTIASWKHSFVHLEKAIPNEQKTIRLQSKWLNKKDSLTLDQISSCEDSGLRRALFWNFLAIRLIKNSHHVKVIHYDDLVLNTNHIINKIREMTHQEFIDLNLESSTVKSKKSGLSDTEIELIKSITNCTYKHLLSLRVA